MIIDFCTVIFWTILLAALPFYSLTNSTARPFAPPPFRGSLTVIAALRQRFAPLHGGVRRIKKSLHGFFYDCRIATQFCMLLTRHPWLDTYWQERVKNPSVDFLGYWRTAWQFSKLLSRASMRSLLFGKYDKNSMDFFMIAELLCNSA